MNTGKTRIYELSKELNRDNKDILEICERLNISVKSHSSTITDAQVERIRAEAQRSPQKSPTRSFSSSGGPRSSRSERDPRKPQIREIVKLSPTASGREVSSSPSSPTLAEPPRPFAKPKLSRPDAEQPHTSPIEPEEAESAPRPPQPPQPIAAEQPPEPVQLLHPPSRPTKSQETVRVSSPERPVLKKPKKKDKASGASRDSASKGTTPSEAAPAKFSGSSPKPPSKLQSSGLKPKPPQLVKPGTPPEVAAKSSGLGEEIADEDDELPIEDTGERAIQKLKRPTLPRLVKRTPDWEDEEEEGAEAKGKSGKASKSAPKTKRRPHLLEDDDEDFEAELLDSHLPTPTAVSLSVARPPKPASLTRGTAPSSSGKKAKKPTPKSESAASRDRGRERRQGSKSNEPAAIPEQIVLPESLTVRELADLLNIAETEVIAKLFTKGIAVNITQTIDLSTAKLITEELGVTVETAAKKSAATKTTEMLDEGDLESLQRRPPVVTIMGHVDHGKTTLLDAIRQTKVAQGEAGGITQHIGAYHVDVEHDDKTEQVVFLDTPGHEAFTAMRARGTRVTDIAILVVAADDGVQPQTKEAISHARAAGVPIIVAINKIDKPEAQPERIMQELTELELVPEEWGGETIMVPVSAISGENLDTLLEMILLVAEVEQLEANPNRKAKGTIIEAHLDKAKGSVATLLVQNGTLHVGDIIVAGSAFGKIRAMIDDRGHRVDAATPSFAAEILGLNDVPQAGDEFEVFENEKDARMVAEALADEHRESRLQKALSSRRVTLSSLSAQAQEGELKELNLIVKADVQGSVEALLSALRQIPQNEVQIRILLGAPGEVTETDVALAAASGAVIVGFNTTLAAGARQAGEREGVDIREYSIIYNLLDDIQAAMEGLLEPEEVEEHLGNAEVRAVFPVGKGAVAGCYVLSGKVVRNRRIRVRRGDAIVYEGVLDSLKRMKDDEREVKSGFECGIGVSKFNDWKVSDIIEAYQMILKRRTLSVK